MGDARQPRELVDADGVPGRARMPGDWLVRTPGPALKRDSHGLILVKNQQCGEGVSGLSRGEQAFGQKRKDDPSRLMAHRWMGFPLAVTQSCHRLTTRGSHDPGVSSLIWIHRWPIVCPTEYVPIRSR